jgi:hypothetical protein
LELELPGKVFFVFQVEINCVVTAREASSIDVMPFTALLLAAEFVSTAQP